MPGGFRTDPTYLEGVAEPSGWAALLLSMLALGTPRRCCCDRLLRRFIIECLRRDLRAGRERGEREIHGTRLDEFLQQGVCLGFPPSHPYTYNQMASHPNAHTQYMHAQQSAAYMPAQHNTHACLHSTTLCTCMPLSGRTGWRPHPRTGAVQSRVAVWHTHPPRPHHQAPTGAGPGPGWSGGRPGA